MNFDTLKALVIPEGNVKKIMVDGVTRWLKQSMILGAIFSGQATALSSGRQYIAAESNANYIFFAGGSPDNDIDTAVTTVEWYDKNLSKGITNTKLPVATYRMSSGQIGNYALFASGEGSDRVRGYDLNAVSMAASNMSGWGTPVSFLLGGKLCFIGFLAEETELSDDGKVNYREICDMLRSYSTNLSMNLAASNFIRSVIGGKNYWCNGLKAAGNGTIAIVGCIGYSDRATAWNNYGTDSVIGFNSSYTASTLGEITNDLGYSNSNMFVFVGLSSGIIVAGHNANTKGYLFDNNFTQTLLSGFPEWYAYGWPQPVVLNDKAYMLGQNFDGSNIDHKVLSIDTNCVISESDQPITSGDLRQDRVGMGAFNGKLFVVGGKKEDNLTNKYVDIFTPV